MHESDEILWGRTRIRYAYRYAARKTLAIDVHPDLSVTVTAPHGTHLNDIRARVHKRGGWIRKSWREFELYLPKSSPRYYLSGESHRYLGRQYRLKVVEGPSESVKCLRGYFWVTVSELGSPRRVRELLGCWYLEKARALFSERLQVCHARARREGIELPALVIRSLRMRWGSCSREGRITLNLDLIKAPKECIDYVIMHEMCHLKEHHHGPRFWRLLSQLMPDYQERRRKLNQFAGD